MQIVEFGTGTLRFLEQAPAQAPATGFTWIFLEREALEQHLPALQAAAQRLGGSPIHELHLKDLANRSHPSRYDYTSIYDLVVFRRLATDPEVCEELGPVDPGAPAALLPFTRVRTRAVGFVVYDRLLVTVHPAGCFTARSFIQRYLADALQAEGLSAARPADSARAPGGGGEPRGGELAIAARSRLPAGPADLMLRMLNVMVDSYLDLRKELSTEMDRWQQELLGPRPRGADWAALMAARNTLHALEDFCEEQNDAIQEWLDAQQEQTASWMSQAERDGLLARARDVAEHINRVVHHVRRMEHNAETAVQIHFSALGHRTNEIMRMLTALTAIFLPLNLIAGIFGMNFEFLPLIHRDDGFSWTLGSMAGIAVVLGVVFWRKRYLARSGR